MPRSTPAARVAAVLLLGAAALRADAIALPGEAHPSGFLEAVVTEPVVARVESFRGGELDLTLVPSGARVELVHPPVDAPSELRALLPDGRTVWLPTRSLRLRRDSRTLSSERVLAAEEGRVYRPLRDLPRGIDYQFQVREGARLHLVTVDLRQAPALEFLPVLARGRGRRAARPVAELARRAGALVAVNGPFFLTSGRQSGQPLGILIVDREVVHEVTDPFVRGLDRSFVALTSARRLVMGETSESAFELLRKNRADVFFRERLSPGERIVTLVGGLGRLARDDDPEAWRLHAGHQFAARFYGGGVRRPQCLVGLGQGGKVLYLLVQEGRPHSQRCFTLPELSVLLVGEGAEQVAFNDGGGSAELVVQGRPVVRTEGAGPRRRNNSVLVVRPRPRGGTMWARNSSR